MNTLFPNSRFNRSYLQRVAAEHTGAEKAPDRDPIHGGPVREVAVSMAPVQAPVDRQPAAAIRPPAPGRRPHSVLEICHPEIAKAITLLWGFPEMNEYFDRLWLADNNQGPIDPEAMSELMLLARLHQTFLPQRPSRTMASFYGSSRLFGAASDAASPDVWSDVPPRR